MTVQGPVKKQRPDGMSHGGGDCMRITCSFVYLLQTRQSLGKKPKAPPSNSNVYPRAYGDGRLEEGVGGLGG